MIRSFHLGNEGETAAQHLLDVYDLSTTFEPCLAISPHARALDELRRRLAEKASRLERWEPDEDLGRRARRLIEDARGSRPVVWLQQERFDPDAWKAALGHLQRQREAYRAEAPWLWVLAGPPELVPLMQEHAMHVLSGVTVHVTLNEAPRRLATVTGPLRWLHLSDFHFQALERWDRRKTIQALLRHVEKLCDKGHRPDFVFVTGDVAFSGQRQEYDQAVLFFTALAEKLGLEPRERFFFVPGNHDVDRRAIGAGDRRILKGVDSQDDVEDLFGDPETMALLGRRLESFYAFTERFLGTARGWRGERPWRVDVRQAGGVDVGILQLNSAWTSGPDDSQGLVVGEVQVQRALEECADAFLRIVLVHHPLADLKDFDRERLETLYATENVHFLLRGHLHRNRTQAVATPDGLVVELAAGAVYPGGKYDKTYLAADADLGAGQATVRFYRYSESGKGFWTADNLTYERAENGVWTFALPAGLKLDAEAPPPAERELTPSRRATLAARYRAAAAAVHGTVRFVGFADHRPRPNVQVPELFVPLRLEARDEKKKSWTTAELVGRLLEKPAEGGGAARVAVLGDPGSGKTTLCRFTAVAVAGEAECDGLRVTDEVLPLFLPFRDYVRVCRETGERSLVEYLAEQARVQLQVAVPEGFLEATLDDGRAVLLLDGLDEVGAAEDRVEMRGRVQAFCRLYPRTPVLVTSRFAGYDDAPLPRQGPEAFVHLGLAAFDDDDLRRFVTSWYAVQEANDPVARDRGAADLAAALEADERVRELARNPMLATLIALVHRYEAHLPGERAALYDICVKTLIETWPAARKRTFREIDAGLQRAYLEALALRMQRERSRGDKEVVIERGTLIDALVEILRQRGGTLGPDETTRGLVERWVRFLEEGTGILVEQRPGVFAFFHLSLMEYLAARGLDAEGNLVEAISERFGEPTWHAVCLLAVGSRATDKAFLDRLYDALGEQPVGWPFLYQCLREEAAFDDEQRETIVRRIGSNLLDMGKYSWRDPQQVLEEVMRFSLRHHEWARSWVAKELATADGEALQGIVLLRLQRQGEILEIIKRRSDTKRIAPALLDYWPDSDIGFWAVAETGALGSFTWATNSPGDLLVLRSLASLRFAEDLAPGYVSGLLRWTASWAESLARSNFDRVADVERPGARGLPTGVRAEPGALTLHAVPVQPMFLLQEAKADFARFFAREFARSLARDFALYFALEASRYFARGLTQDFIRSFALGFAREFAQYFPRDFAQYLSLDVARRFARDFAQPFAPPLTIDFDLEVLEAPPDIPLRNPRHDEVAPDARALRDLEETRDRDDAERLIATLFARLAAEAWIAAVTTAKASQEERLAYVHRRVQNAWLLQLWPAVDRLLPDDPDPARLALYLTLGFSQAVTTWQWPATERWIALLGEEPAHWLPRSQWHLCYLLHDPDDDAHRRALDAALDEGLKDAEQPWVAEELRKLIVPAT